MNITSEIGKEMGADVSRFLEKTPEIQVYANANLYKYQWRDGRFLTTSDVWKNKSYDTRAEMRNALMVHFKTHGGIQSES